ncbi:MAG: hypothetical protein AAFS10_11895 [Myxococcota bacterium]
MREILLALAILTGLIGLAALSALPWEQTLTFGWWVTGIGMALGVPTGVVYHVQLYRKLNHRDALPNDWIWRPIGCNELLTPHERGAVIPWSIAGGVGFVIVVLGILIVALALASAWISIVSG